jgi:hypothetical protein
MLGKGSASPQPAKALDALQKFIKVGGHKRFIAADIVFAGSRLSNFQLLHFLRCSNAHVLYEAS